MDALISLVAFLTSLNNGTSPRESLIHVVLQALLHPSEPNLLTQTYFDQMSIFLMLAVAGFAIELPTRFYRAWKGGADAGGQLKEGAISVLFLFWFVGLLPGVLMACRSGFNEFAKMVALNAFGSTDENVVSKSLSILSGNPPLDFLLTIVQVMFIMIFSITLVILPIVLWVSGCLLIVGIGFRWTDTVGASLLHFSLSLAIYAVVGNAANLIFIGLMSAATKYYYKDNLLFYALANTGILALSAIFTIMLLFILKSKISTVVSGMVSVIKGGVATVRDGYQRMRGAGDRQVNDAIASRKNRFSTGTSNAFSKFKRQSQTPEMQTGDDQPMPQPEPSTPRRSTTAARSRSRLTDGVDLAGKAAVAATTRSPAAVAGLALSARNAMQNAKSKSTEPPAQTPPASTPDRKVSTGSSAQKPAPPTRPPSVSTRATAERPRPAAQTGQNTSTERRPAPPPPPPSKRPTNTEPRLPARPIQPPTGSPRARMQRPKPPA